MSGCATLVIVITAVLVGLWLDGTFHSKPVLTFVLLITSVPISILAMLFIVRKATSKIKTGSSRPQVDKQEVDIGKD